jgi:hypothetical protein
MAKPARPEHLRSTYGLRDRHSRDTNVIVFEANSRGPALRRYGRCTLKGALYIDAVRGARV